MVSGLSESACSMHAYHKEQVSPGHSLTEKLQKKVWGKDQQGIF
jgi:hypothetical protein